MNSLAHHDKQYAWEKPTSGDAVGIALWLPIVCTFMLTSFRVASSCIADTVASAISAKAISSMILQR